MTDFERSKYRHPRIAYLGGADTLIGVVIDSASTTKPAAIVRANVPCGKRMHHLFGNQRRQIDLFSRIVTQP